MKKLGPYKLGKVHCVDCLEAMKVLPDNCGDVVTDPPYGIGEALGRNKNRGSVRAAPTKFGKKKWDNQMPSNETFHHLLRIAMNAVIFGGNYFSNVLPPSSAWIVWDKDNGTNDFADCELAWTNLKKAVRKFRWKWNGYFQEPGYPKEKRVHPTQKPTALMIWVIKNYTKDNRIIIDPFAGSGTTGVACVSLKRDFVGFDTDPEYCKIANERIQAVTRGVSVKEARSGLRTLFEKVEE